MTISGDTTFDLSAGDELPRSSRGGHAARCLGYAEALGEVSIRNATRAQFSDGLYVSASELRVAESLAFGLAALQDHVVLVLPVGADEEVIWIDTPTVVAAMTDEHAGRDRSVDKLPGVAVCLDGLVADADFSVPSRSAASPYPARRRFLDVWPEAVADGDGGGHRQSALISEHVVTFAEATAIERAPASGFGTKHIGTIAGETR